MKKKGSFILAVSALIVGLLAGAAFSQTTQQEIVRTKAFEVVDHNGVARVRMGVSPNGSGFVHIYDSSGQLIWSAPTPTTRMLPVQK